MREHKNRIKLLDAIALIRAYPDKQAHDILASQITGKPYTSELYGEIYLVYVE